MALVYWAWRRTKTEPNVQSWRGNITIQYFRVKSLYIGCPHLSDIIVLTDSEELSCSICPVRRIPTIYILQILGLQIRQSVKNVVLNIEQVTLPGILQMSRCLIQFQIFTTLHNPKCPREVLVLGPWIPKSSVSLRCMRSIDDKIAFPTFSAALLLNL